MVGIVERLGVSGDKKLKIIGLVLMAFTGLLTTLANGLVQFVSKRLRIHAGLTLSSFEVLFVRSVIQLFFCVIYMFWLKVHPFGSKLSNLALLLLMGLVEVAAIICIYLALEKIPVGDETVIRVTSPVFTAIFSFFILRRGCTVFEGLCGIVSFLGVIIIAKPDWFGKLHSKDIHAVEVHRGHFIDGSPITETVVIFDSGKYYIGAALAVSAAILLALFYVLNKLAGKRYDIVLTVFYPSLIGIVVSPLGMMIFQSKVLISELSGQTWGILYIVGFLCFVGLMFMAEAFQLEDPGPVALVRNLDPVFAFLLQYFLLSVTITLSSVVGAIIILAATSVLVGSRCVRKRNSAEDDGIAINDKCNEEKDPLVDISGEADVMQ